MKNKLSLSLFSALLFAMLVTCFSFKIVDEGMFPLSDLSKLDLKKAGLQIERNEIYNPNGISLTDALVNIGGCSGSFVSDKGLIITNHHCAFGAVQLASTPEKDYIRNGFSAPTLDKEIPAKGLTCRITESYVDVSEEVLSSVQSMLDPVERVKTIKAKIQEIVKREEAKDKNIKAEVSEMFSGRNYVLFRYLTLQDVRLVYVPRRTIGEFGGESDNWVWPRHTGDYSFVRAYMGPDGNSAPFSEKNIPYKPKKFLKVNANGIGEEDFVFILGYPGKTYRHYPSQYLAYQEKYLLPYISELYTWENEQMAQTAYNDKALELKQATRMKRNANVLKNYKGKLQGISRIDLIAQKQEEEKQLQAFINSDSKMKERYGNLLANVDNYYKDFCADATRDLWFNEIYKSTNMLAAANVINLLQTKLIEFDKSKRDAYIKETLAKNKTTLENIYSSFVFDTDKRILKRMLSDAIKLPDNQRVIGMDKLMKSRDEKHLNEYIDKLFADTKFKDEKFAANLLETSNWEALMKFKDPMLKLAEELNNQLVIITQVRQKREGVFNRLMSDLVDVKNQWKNQAFVPDANATLRLTYGYVRGYSPADATYNSPFTTLKGVIEKGNSGPDYEMPLILKELYKKKDFGQFVHPKLKDVPVAFLYNLDTTNGSSGSPVMNSKGELVGVNFDRAITATIGDFAYNESYSRAMGVDIRYILWVAQKVDKADYILKELGVALQQ